MPATPADRQAALLRVTVALRQAIEDAGETYVKHLKGMKKIWFDQVRRTSEQLASSAASGYTLSETAIYRNLLTL